jgi:hypothetical protein
LINEFNKNTLTLLEASIIFFLIEGQKYHYFQVNNKNKSATIYTSILQCFPNPSFHVISKKEKSMLKRLKIPQSSSSFSHARAGKSTTQALY